MNLLPSPEQEALVASARGFLAAEAPVAGGDDPADLLARSTALWPKLAEIGWLSLAVPTGSGGLGGSRADQALVFRELGRSVVPGPFAGSVYAAAAAAAAGRDDLAGQLMVGEATAGLGDAWRDPSASISPVVTGRWRVVDTAGDGLALLVERAGVALVRLEGARVRRLDGPDPTVPVAEAVFEGTRPEAFVGPDEPIGPSARVAAAAMLVGMTEACRDQSVAYALVREQFGQPIGSFQAVKHRCADMAVRAEASASLVVMAALALDEGAADGPSLAASAKALASEYAVASAHDNVQNHGGVGFTAECSAHRYVKRALSWASTLGSPERLYPEVVR